jgi:hypothetical protein
MMLIPLYGLPVLKLRGNGPPVKCGDFHGFSHGITPALRLAMMRSVTVWYRLNFGAAFVGAFLLMGGSSAFEWFGCGCSHRHALALAHASEG